jgi:hypothetical protein
MRNNSNKQFVKFTLSSLIDKYKFEGFVFIQSCRPADELLEYSDTITTDLYRLTHLMRILNKSIWFEDDDVAYKECDKILKIPKSTSREYIKSRIELNNETLQKLENIRKNANTSLRTRYFNLERVGFSQNLIGILHTLDENNLASTYEAIVLELRTYEYEPDKIKLFYLNINKALNSVENKKDYLIYLGVKFIMYLNILLSFFIYWQILLDKNEFKNFMDSESLEEQNNINNISFLFLGGCNLTTPVLEKLLVFLKRKKYNYVFLNLQNNEITNIPLELLNADYVNIYNINLKGNDLSYDVVDSSKYLDKTNIDDKTKLPEKLNENVYETFKKYYALKKLEEDAPFTLENTLFTDLNKKEKQVYDKPPPFNGLDNTFMTTTGGGFFSKNKRINHRMMTSKLNMKRKNKLTKLLKYSNRK